MFSRHISGAQSITQIARHSTRERTSGIIIKLPPNMVNRLACQINIALIALSLCTAGYFAFHWNQLRPRVVETGGPNCRETLDDDAYYLALICQALINEKGSLPADPAQLGRAIADNASRLGFTWPNNLTINASGLVCDCTGEPFKIVVMSDRIAITSDSLYASYFAGLKKSSGDSHKR